MALYVFKVQGSALLSLYNTGLHNEILHSQKMHKQIKIE